MNLFLISAGLAFLALVVLAAARLARRRRAAWGPEEVTDDEVIAAIKSCPAHFASAVTTQKIGARNNITIYAHKPNATSAQVLTPDQQTTRIWLDMRDYEWFAAIACNHTLTGNGLTLMEIMAAEDSSGTNSQVILTGATLTGTAVDNGGFLEIKAAQVREVAASSGKNLRYVSVRLTVQNSSDTLAVALILADAKHPQNNLTPLTM